MTDATQPAPPPRRRLRLGRILLGIFLGLLVVLAALVGAAIYQARTVAAGLVARAPLEIPPEIRDPVVHKQLEEELKAEVSQGGVMQLSGFKATLILQAALRDRALRGTLRRERRRVIEALAEVPDPLGVIGALRLGELDLDALRGDVAIADGEATARLTAPYTGPDGGHLNLSVRLRGAWAPGAPEVDLRALHIGEVELLGLTGTGRFIKNAVEDALRQRTREVHQLPLKTARLEGDRLVLELRPPAPQAEP